MFLYIKITNKYYQKHKENPPKEAPKKYQNISEEKKHERQKKARERYQNFTDKEKGKKVSIIMILIKIIKILLRNKSRG